MLTLSILGSRDNDGPLLSRYALRRIFRLFPLVFLVVTVALVWMYFMRQALGLEDAIWSRYTNFSFSIWLRNVLVLNTHFNTPGWTLEFEVAAYAILPFVVLAIIRKRPVYWAVGIFLASLYVQKIGWFTFFQIMPMFVPGIVLGFALHRRESIPSTAMLAVGVLAIGILIEVEKKHYSLSFLTASGCACIVAWAATAAGGAVKFLSLKSLRFLGDISYSVYLWHYPIFWSIPYLMGSFVGTKDWWTFMWMGIVGIPMTIIVSALCYAYFERPLMNFASKIGRSRSVAASPA